MGTTVQYGIINCTVPYGMIPYDSIMIVVLLYDMIMLLSYMISYDIYRVPVYRMMYDTVRYGMIPVPYVRTYHMAAIALP